AAGCARAGDEPALWRSSLPRFPPEVGSGYYRMGLMNWWAWSEASVPVSPVTSCFVSVNAPTRTLSTEVYGPARKRDESAICRRRLHRAPARVYDAIAQAVGIPHGPPEERPLPTSRSDLTSPAPRLKERLLEQGGPAILQPALPGPIA